MEIPSDRKYTKDHEWVKVEGGVATVGITAFAQDELGEIVFFEAPPAGKSVKQGETLCVVESTKAASDVYAPISGTVKESNATLGDAPSIINSAPYSEGWLVKLEKTSEAELAALMSAEQYKNLIGAK